MASESLCTDDSTTTFENHRSDWTVTGSGSGFFEGDAAVARIRGEPTVAEALEVTGEEVSLQLETCDGRNSMSTRVDLDPAAAEELADNLIACAEAARSQEEQ